MNKKISTIFTAVLAVSMIPWNVYAEETDSTETDNTKYTVTFMDFDGNVMETMEVSPDEKIDYSAIDTSSLHSHLNTYTEQDFYMWSATPEYITSDTVIDALYKRATISVDSIPSITEFTDTNGDVPLDGLSVSITIDVQTPVKDENGDYYVSTKKEEITSSCYAEVSSLAELFADGNTATVNVFPPGDDKPIVTYEITLTEPIDEKYTLTFTDFDGNILETMEVSPDEKIDYSKIDTSSLHTNPDQYTEQYFNTWSATPEYITSDTVINALYKKETISVDSVPSITEFTDTNGDVPLDGLSVSITTDTQTPDKDENGNYIVSTQKEEITSSCYAEISSLAELFADGKTANVNILSPKSDKSIVTYEITLTEPIDEKYTLTFTDFDGNILETMEVRPNEKIDYSKIDTSSLHTHIDKYTEQAFNMWSSIPEYITSDTVINALYKKETISVDSVPSITEFTDTNGDVPLDGLSVSITTDTQTPDKDENGNYIVSTQKEEITSSCYAEISSLAELFADGKTANVNILSPKSDKSIVTYEITLTEPIDEKYTLTFTDFDGNILETMEVRPNEKIDYSKIDTSSLHTHIDKYTEQAFNMWSSIPEYITSDTVINALYKRESISVESVPHKTEFYTAYGDVPLDGLSITITIETQIPVKDENGNYIVSTQKEEIASSCYAEISSLEKLFADGKTATVNVFPPGDNKPILTYEITLFDELGDINGDNFVDSVDAAFVLQTYAEMSTGKNPSLDEKQTKICDVNRDGLIDAVDATAILIYYAEASTGQIPIWEEIVPALA